MAPADPSPDPVKLRWAWRGVFGLLAATLVVLMAMPWVTTDYDAYHRAAGRVDRGEPLYRMDELGFWHAYRYPPAVAYALIPLGQLDVAVAGRLWFVGNWIALAGCIGLAVRLVFGPRPWDRNASFAALVAFAAGTCYIANNLYQGQVGLWMTLACLAWAWSRETGRNFTGGLFLAVGCALKLAPVLIVPYLVLRKDWRGLAGVVAGGAAAFLLPAAWIGIDGTVALHKEWQTFLADTQAPLHNYRQGNQGLMGLLARLPAVSNGLDCYSFEKLAWLERYYPLIVLGLSAAVYGWIARDLWRRTTSGASPRDSDNFHLVLLLVFLTLANPCAWRCNFVTLLLPCVVLGRHVAERKAGSLLSRRTVQLVTMSWVWPVLVALVQFGRWLMIPDRTASLSDLVKGGAANTAWSPIVWLAQGAHFWVAVLTVVACRQTVTGRVIVLPTAHVRSVLTRIERFNVLAFFSRRVAVRRAAE